MTINNQAVSLAENKFGIKPIRHWVILNGVDDAFLAENRNTDSNNGVFEFLYVGRLHEGKGLIELLDAFRIVLDQHLESVSLKLSDLLPTMRMGGKVILKPNWLKRLRHFQLGQSECSVSFRILNWLISMLGRIVAFCRLA